MRPETSLRDVIEATSRAIQMPVQVIVGQGQGAGLARHRAAGIVVGRELTGFSTPVIGRAFGRDHTTVIRVLRRAGSLAVEVAAIRREVETPSAQGGWRGPTGRDARAVAPAEKRMSDLVAAAARLERDRYSAFEGRAIDQVLKALRAMREAGDRG